MILRRIVESIRSQSWAVAFMELFIVVVGVFIGLQVDTWNDTRLEEKRREQIMSTLATFLGDARGVQERLIAEIEFGLASWESAVADGGRPPPFVFRHEGSDTAPEIWSTIGQMQLTNLFDPVTLFDLTFYFSELDGVGRKYIRYVTFVENEVLPGMISDQDVFYDKKGRLNAKFQANMDRLREHIQENLRLIAWADCLVYRLEAKRTFEQSCLRVDHQLEGMSGKSN
jgi:hypothetical protein